MCKSKKKRNILLKNRAISIYKLSRTDYKKLKQYQLTAMKHSPGQ